MTPDRPLIEPRLVARNPILLGAKGTPLDWSDFHVECARKIGRVPVRDERLSRDEWRALGYSVAGNGVGR